MMTRSKLQIMLEFAAVVQVPESDVAHGKATRVGRSFGHSAERPAFTGPGCGCATAGRLRCRAIIMPLF